MNLVIPILALAAVWTFLSALDRIVSKRDWQVVGTISATCFAALVFILHLFSVM